MSGGADYHASWWRLRELGQRDLLVPLSCCELDNAGDADGFLDPRPSNLTLCQSLQHEAARPHRHMEVRTPNPLIGRDTKAACTCSMHPSGCRRPPPRSGPGRPGPLPPVPPVLSGARRAAASSRLTLSPRPATPDPWVRDGCCVRLLARRGDQLGTWSGGRGRKPDLTAATACHLSELVRAAPRQAPGRSWEPKASLRSGSSSPLQSYRPNGMS